MSSIGQKPTSGTAYYLFMPHGEGISAPRARVFVKSGLAVFIVAIVFAGCDASPTRILGEAQLQEAKIALGRIVGESADGYLPTKAGRRFMHDQVFVVFETPEPRTDQPVKRVSN